MRRTSKSRLVQLVQRGLDDARGDLDAAGQAGGRRVQQREVLGGDAGALGHLGGNRLGRGLPGLQAQHRLGRLLVHVEVVVELLGPDQRTARPARHREEVVALELPAGVLGGQAGPSRMIGDDRQPGPPAPVERQRRERHPAQAAHADLGEAPPRLEAAGDVAAAVHEPGPVGERRHRDAQQPPRPRRGGRRAGGRGRSVRASRRLSIWIGSRRRVLRRARERRRARGARRAARRRAARGRRRTASGLPCAESSVQIG